jgi:hypothetical protein
MQYKESEEYLNPFLRTLFTAALAYWLIQYFFPWAAGECKEVPSFSQWLAGDFSEMNCTEEGKPWLPLGPTSNSTFSLTWTASRPNKFGLKIFENVNNATAANNLPEESYSAFIELAKTVASATVHWVKQVQEGKAVGPVIALTALAAIAGVVDTLFVPLVIMLGVVVVGVSLTSLKNILKSIMKQASKACCPNVCQRQRFARLTTASDQAKKKIMTSFQYLEALSVKAGYASVVITLDVLLLRFANRAIELITEVGGNPNGTISVLDVLFLDSSNSSLSPVAFKQYVMLAFVSWDWLYVIGVYAGARFLTTSAGYAWMLLEKIPCIGSFLENRRRAVQTRVKGCGRRIAQIGLLREIYFDTHYINSKTLRLVVPMYLLLEVVVGAIRIVNNDMREQSLTGGFLHALLGNAGEAPINLPHTLVVSVQNLLREAYQNNLTPLFDQLLNATLIPFVNSVFKALSGGVPNPIIEKAIDDFLEKEAAELFHETQFSFGNSTSGAFNQMNAGQKVFGNWTRAFHCEVVNAVMTCVETAEVNFEELVNLDPVFATLKRSPEELMTALNTLPLMATMVIEVVRCYIGLQLAGLTGAAAAFLRTSLRSMRRCCNRRRNVRQERFLLEDTAKQELRLLRHVYPAFLKVLGGGLLTGISLTVLFRGIPQAGSIVEGAGCLDLSDYPSLIRYFAPLISIPGFLEKRPECSFAVFSKVILALGGWPWLLGSLTAVSSVSLLALWQSMNLPSATHLPMNDRDVQVVQKLLTNSSALPVSLPQEMSDHKSTEGVGDGAPVEQGVGNEQAVLPGQLAAAKSVATVGDLEALQSGGDSSGQLTAMSHSSQSAQFPEPGARIQVAPESTLVLNLSELSPAMSEALLDLLKKEIAEYPANAEKSVFRRRRVVGRASTDGGMFAQQQSGTDDSDCEEEADVSNNMAGQGAGSGSAVSSAT